MIRPVLVTLATLGLTSAAAGVARADTIPVIEVTLKDGVVTPQHISVDAGKPFMLALRNAGSTAAEFESQRLYKETMLAPGAETLLDFTRLSPGSYPFYDEFHMNLDSANGTITVK